jgi:3-methyladenine DNA glycosylase AlkC
MAEPLKNHFDQRVPRTLARQIATVWPPFRSTAFLADALRDYDALQLMDRGRHLARVLGRHLPPDYREALAILLESVGDPPEKRTGDGGMASFFYLPHVLFVSEFGLDHFEPSMRAQHLLSQRFTAEFSIRPFIERYERETLALLQRWARDPNAHVRRLVSEGTRPRLPWAGRLRRFQENPAPVLQLLELLKDDPELFVRRSVANNLNDIGKDHPELLVKLARRWMVDAPPPRQALIRHALRSLVKQGHRGALAVLGFKGAAPVGLDRVRITPARAMKGGRVTIAFTVRNRSMRAQRLLVDFTIHFVKADGSTSPKVFKLSVLHLTPGGEMRCRKSVTLAELTTRKHYPGRHIVDVLVNGHARTIGAFTILEVPEPGRRPR